MYKLSFFIALLFLSITAKTQTTISTSYGPAPVTFSTGVTYLTFAVRNTNGFPIILTNINCLQANLYENQIYNLYYSATSLFGGPLVPSAPWTLWTSSLQPITTSIITQVTPFDCIGLTIPAFTTYRFALQGTKGTAVRGGVSPNSFSAGGVDLLVGDNVSLGGQVGYFGWQALGTAGAAYFFDGSISFATGGSFTDLQVRSITKPGNVCDATSNSISALVCNKSSQTINFGVNNANVNFNVNGPSGPQTANVPFTSGSLVPCGCVNAAATFNFSAAGNYSITATGTISGVSDVNLANNTTTDQLRNFKPVPGPNDSICQFSNGNLFSGLTASGCQPKNQSIAVTALLSTPLPIDGNSDATAGLFAQSSLPALPPDAQITGGTLSITNLNPNATGSFGNEARFNIYSPLAGGSGSPLVPGIAGNFLNFSVYNFDYKSLISATQINNMYNQLGVGGTISIGYWESNNNAPAVSDVALNAQGDATIVTLTINYVIVPGVKWYTNAVGGASFYQNSPMNPFVAAGSGLTSTANTGTYTFYAACNSDTLCRVPITLKIKPSPAVFQDSLSACELIAASGNALFDLASIEDSVSGNNPLATVSFYQDLNLSLLITNPSSYTSGTDYAYSKVEVNGCASSDSVYLLVQPTPKFFSSFVTGTICQPDLFDAAILIDPFSISPPGTDTLYFADSLFTISFPNPHAIAVTDTVYMIFKTNTIPSCADSAYAIVNVLPINNYLVSQDTVANFSIAGNLGCTNFILNDGLLDTLRAGYDCSRIVGIHDLPNGISLGNTSVCTEIDASVMNHNGQPYVNRHFQITPTNNDSADVCLYFLDDDFQQYNSTALGLWPALPTIADPSKVSNMCIAQIDNGDLNTPGHTVTNIPNSALTITYDTARTIWSVCFRVDSFSYFYCHACNPLNIPLNVSLTNFKASKMGDLARIDWQTLQERNNKHFIVERSKDGIDFRPISTPISSKALNGESSTLLAYSFNDYAPIQGLNYYRLMQVDIDEKKYYSEVVPLYFGMEAQIKIYPNPVNNELNVSIVSQKPSKAFLKITDAIGRNVHQVEMMLEAGNNEAKIDVDHLTDGIYLIQVTNGKGLNYTQTIRKK